MTPHFYQFVAYAEWLFVKYRLRLVLIKQILLQLEGDNNKHFPKN
jgi:hypothetical protein